uniref:Variant surface glycoprotein n=1 Tax=Trypanosoma brucei TaxID=5691 RepID=S5G770_9TRYP|nr:variant surface glycoprotein [Trypanosoma brucei]
MPRIPVAQALLILTAAEAAVISTNDEVADAVNNICQENYFLGELDKRMQQLASAGSAGKKRNKLQAERWQKAAAATADATKRCLYSALSVYLTTELRAMETPQSELSRAATDARLAIARHRGLLEAMQQTAKTKLSEAASTHSNPNANTVKLALKLAADSTQTCSAPAGIAAIRAGATSIDWNRVAKIKLSDPADLHNHFHITTISLDAFNACQGNQAEETQTLQAAFNGCSGQNAKRTLSSATRAAPAYPGKPESLYNDNDPTKACRQEAAKGGANHNSKEAVLYTVCQANKQQQPSYSNPELFSGKTLAQISSLRLFARNCIPELHKIQDTSADLQEGELTKFLETKLGSDNKQFKENFLENLKTEQTEIRKTKNTETKNIYDVAEGEETIAALSTGEGKRNRNELQALNKNKAAVELGGKDSKDCKGETDEGKCNKKDGCEFKDGECKVKEEVKGGNDGKTTNTTGNNSFVISKTPLWLAVLLF